MHDFVNDELFDLEKSKEYILSIQVRLGGFSFSVVSPVENRLLAFKNTPVKISNETLIARHFKEWLDSIDILRYSFKTIRIIVFNDKFTLVPDTYYSEEITNNIPQLLFSENGNMETEKNQIEFSESKLIFSLPKGLKNIIKDKVGICVIIHPVYLITHQLPETKEEKGLVLLFDEKNIYITIFNKYKILFSNCFKINNVNDITYYVLTTLKQLELTSKSIEIFYAGKSDLENETFIQLKNYFNLINVLPDKMPFTFDRNKFTQPFHQNLTLYS